MVKSNEFSKAEADGQNQAAAEKWEVSDSELTNNSPEQNEESTNKVDNAANRLADIGQEALDDMAGKAKESFGTLKEYAKDKLEKSKTKLSGFGRAAAAFAKKAGLVTIGGAIVAGRKVGEGAVAGVDALDRGTEYVANKAEQGVENATEGIKNAKESIVGGVKNAKESVSNKVTDVKEGVSNKVNDVKENIQARAQAYEDSRKANKLEAEAKQEYEKEKRQGEISALINGHLPVDKNEMTEAFREGWESGMKMREEFDKAKEAKEAKRNNRHEAALKRKQKRQEMYQNVRDRSSETYEAAKSKARKIGGSIVRFAKRAKNAAQAANSAARNTWQESAA